MDDISKITSADYAAKGASSLPDIPEMAPAALKRKFDEIPIDLLIPKLNEVIDRANDLKTIAEQTGQVTEEQIESWTAAAARKIITYSTVISVIDWEALSSGSYYALGYTYVAAVPVTDVTATMFAEVAFSAEALDAYKFAPTCETGAGTVSVYAASLPDSGVAVSIAAWGE